ncbi:histone-lysine N-methyltransferase family member SUVH9-like [Lolium perenne]|uniref:histone-lysine N-methyltransferase family member SUVH9-like n=1 Tax=Lolium perenne TaxID=4522 RepID=UPI0021EB036C|nr:histone-lysine N-methyltransferase family member SUVH9-like [Lolium perenne]
MESPPPPPPQILLTPKPDPDAPPSPTPTTHTALIPKPEPDAPTALTPELYDIYRRDLEPSPDDHPHFALQLRHSQLQLDAASANLRLTAPNPQDHANLQVSIPLPPDAAAAATSSSATKKRNRAGEMVRVTSFTPQDHAHFRSIVRHARLTFEALRGIYHRQDNYDGARNRSDLRASSKMLSLGLWLYRNVRIVGPIPGVQVGDAFAYRAELCVVGLHCTPQAGICYIPASLVSEGHPVATSIVSSGGYLDDEDSGDVLVYTGSGGRQRNRVEHHADQTLQRGNLALHYSYHYGVEVRVIRCHACESSSSRKVYVYDGLYRVVSSTFGPGKSGRDVCKYKLLRLPDQEELGSKNWCLAKEIKDMVDSKVLPPGYISLDLSNGKEAFPVAVCNNVDQESSLLDFDYIAHPELPLSLEFSPAKRHKGCHCNTTCGSSCSCVRKNGGGPVYNEDGTLVRGRPIVYECGDLCDCTMSCLNRLTQREMKHRLEVFRSKETEWGVRTLDLIQPGAFVCEYSGDVVPSDVAMDEDSFIDPKRLPKRWREWGDASDALLDDNVSQFHHFREPSYVLDVSQRRNFASYISHSSSPNAFIQYVLRGNENESCPHLMVFAMDTIPPMRELSIDYGIDQQVGP